MDWEKLENGECESLSIECLNKAIAGPEKLLALLAKIRVNGVINIGYIDGYQLIADVFTAEKSIYELNDFVKENNIFLQSCDVREVIKKNFKVLVEDKNGCEVYISARRMM